MAITSRVAKQQPFLEIADWQRAGLLKPSALKPVLATIDKRQILKRLGSLTKGDAFMLFLAMLSIFDGGFERLAQANTLDRILRERIASGELDETDLE